MATAVFNRKRNVTVFWTAVSHGTRPSIGPDLLSIKHSCSHLLFNSTASLGEYHLDQPELYASEAWVQSARAMPNGTVFFLVHNEFHGWRTSNVENDKCGSS